MKTLFTFKKVINDAGQLALTEGHTVLTSSPRVSPRGLLSFKGEIVKTHKPNKCSRCEGQSRWRQELCPNCKGTGNEVQTWPWDTIIHMSTITGKDTIPGTDIEIIYDREAKVYRRDPNPVKPSEELAKS